MTITPEDVAKLTAPDTKPAKPQPDVLTAATIGGLKVESVSEQTFFLNILIYGDSGVGKTTLAGSASMVPEMAPVLLLNLEGGTLSLKERYPDVKVVNVKNVKHLQSVYDDLLKGKHGYRTVVLDSLSETQKTSMATIMRELVLKEPDRDPDVPGIREWGKSSEQIRRLVRGYRDLPMHCVFIAHAKVDQEDSGKKVTKPSLPGQLANEVGGFVDEVFYYYIKRVDNQPTRMLLTTKTDKEQAKDRSGKLAAVVTNPTMAEIYSAIYNES